MAEEMVIAAKAERKEILTNLNNVRDDIEHFEKMLKPHIPKPPIMATGDTEEEDSSVSDDSI
jgi:hypothetical protein